MIDVSLDCEKTILGCAMLDADFDEISSRLTPVDFSLDSHQRIYRTMLSLAKQNRAIDTVTVAEELIRVNEISAVGGVSYLVSLIEGVPVRMSPLEYVSIVQEKSRLRKIVRFAQEAALRASEGEDSSEVAARLTDALQGIQNAGNDDPLVRSYTLECLNRMERRKSSNSSGLPFGHTGLDAMTGGMQFGFNTTVAARPGVGKTALAKQCIVENCPNGVAVDFFSLEQTREQILWGIWALVAKVPFAVVRDPRQATPVQLENIRSAALAVAEWPLRIYDQTDLQIGEILAMARMSIRKNKSKLLIVDYLQNVKGPGRDLRQRISEVNSGLTSLVKHEECALMDLSQLSRPASRENYSSVPTLFDLKESSQIEQDAHTVVLIHRGWDAELARLSTEGEFIVPKQRFGDTGAVPAHFDRRLVRFE